MEPQQIFPIIIGRDWWTSWDYPERIMHQSFANRISPEDLLKPFTYQTCLLHPRTRASVAASGHSMVKNEEKEFKVSLSVKQFKPEEIQVKVVDENIVAIHGKHEEKSEEDGLISREFTRRYILPKNCEVEQITSSFNPSEGLLEIIVPKKVDEAPKLERIIPVKVDQVKSDKKDT